MSANSTWLKVLEDLKQQRLNTIKSGEQIAPRASQAHSHVARGASSRDSKVPNQSTRQNGNGGGQQQHQRGGRKQSLRGGGGGGGKPQQRPHQQASHHIMETTTTADSTSAHHKQLEELERWVVLLDKLLFNRIHIQSQGPTSSSMPVDSALHFNSSSSSISSEDVASLIVLLAEELPPASDCAHPEVPLKFCELIVSVMSKHEISFKLAGEIDAVLKYLMPMVAQPATTFMRTEALRALSFATFEHGSLFISKFATLAELVLPFAQLSDGVDKDTLRFSVNCLGNMCAKAGSRATQHYQAIFDTLYSLFVKVSGDLTATGIGSSSLCKLLSSILRALQLVVLEGKGLHEPHMASLMSSLTKLMYFGTSSYPVPLTGLSAMSLQSSASSASAPSSSGHDTANASPASSEYSGSDVMGDRYNSWKVRHHALGLLHSIVRCSGQKFVPYWPNVLPQSPQQPSICSILLNDPVHQVRSNACILLASLFDGQRVLLSQAAAETPAPSGSQSSPSSNNSKSFISLSARLAMILREVHHSLVKALETESRPTTQLQLIKCTGSVAGNTPYRNLAPGLLRSLIRQLWELKGRPDQSTPDAILSVQRASLNCLATVIHACGPSTSTTSSRQVDYISELTQCINHLPNATATTHQGQDATANEPTNMIQCILAQVNMNDTPANMIPELFKVLGAIASSAFDCLRSHWDECLRTVVVFMRHQESSCRLFASKVIEDATRSILHTCDRNRAGKGEDDNEPEANSEESSSTTGSQDTRERDLGIEEAQLGLFMGMWHQILHSGLTELVQDKSNLVRACLCNVLAQVPNIIFTRFKTSTQITCVTLMLGAARDEAAAVRAQACRTLGIYILHNSLNTDPLFVTDVGLALVQAMQDPNLNVRIRAAWSLANLCDSLVVVQEGTASMEADSPTDDIPIDTLLSIVKCAIAAAKDNDKVRPNAVRALGNFTRFASSRLFSEQQNTFYLFGSIIDSLITNTKEGTAKVRWNSCYALGNLFHNKDILQFSRGSVDTAISALLSLVQSASNFKIRINACVALSATPSREYFSDAPRAWSILLDALESVDSAEDPASAHYKATLHEQLAKTLLHVGLFLTPADLDNIGSKPIDRMLLALVQYVEQYTRLCDKTSKKPFRELTVFQQRSEAFVEMGGLTANPNAKHLLATLTKSLEYLKTVLQSM